MNKSCENVQAFEHYRFILGLEKNVSSGDVTEVGLLIVQHFSHFVW